MIIGHIEHKDHKVSGAVPQTPELFVNFVSFAAKSNVSFVAKAK